MSAATAIDRLLARIDKDGESDCWVWTGYKTHNGYGRFRGDQQALTLVHRYSYEHHKGPIPDGFQIDHLCRNRACANPAHLEAVTPRANTLRGVGPGGLNALKTHCSAGHEFTEANTYWRARGAGRDCRACRRSRYWAGKDQAVSA